MKCWIIPGFFILISSISASAQTASPPDPAKVALGRDIYDLTQSSQNIAQRMQAVGSAVAKSMPKDGDASKGADVNLALGGVAQIAQDLRPKMREAWATALAEHLDLSELQAIKAFYQSPAGSKLIAEQPEISKEMLQAIMPEMMARMLAQKQAAPKKENTP